MSPAVSESTLESAALSWLEDLGYTVLAGDIPAPGEPLAERARFSAALLPKLLSGEIQVSETSRPTLEDAR